MSDSGESEAERYKPPDYLPRPETPTVSFPFVAIVAGIAVAGLLGLALFVVGQIAYIYILYNYLIGIGIGTAIVLGQSETNKYANETVLFITTAFCSFFAYLVFNFALFLMAFGEMQAEIGELPFFFGFIAFVLNRAAYESFIMGIEPGIFGNFVVWVAEFGITLYFAWSRVSLAIRVRRAALVPSEVTDLITHFSSEGFDVERIRLELAQRGWAQREHQDRALRAVESVALLTQAAEEGKEEKPSAEQGSELYTALIGKKRLDYYVKHFESFDDRGGGFIPSWNWAAFFFTSIWALYRKMYAVFSVTFGISFIFLIFFVLGIIDTALSLGVYVAFMIGFGIYGNALYYRHTKRKFAKARTTVPDAEKLLPYVQSKSGVHVWVIWVFLIPAGAGILAAIFAPACFWDFWACQDEYMIAKAPEDFDEEDRVRLQRAFDAVEQRFNVEGGIQIEEGIRMNQMLVRLQKEKITADELTEFTLLLEGIASPESFAEQSPKAEVLASGICIQKSEITDYAVPQSATGFASSVSELIITKRTSIVPLEKNIGFGFEWLIAGLPSTVNVTYRVEHPLITRPDGSQLTSSEESMVVETVNGILASTDCYILEENYELVPGKWTLSILIDGATLAKQTYQVVRSK